MDEDSQTLTFMLSNYDQSLFSEQPVLTNTGQLTFTPAANVFGTALIDVTLSDGDASSDGTFLITINSVNDQPSFSDFGDITVSEDSGRYSDSWADDATRYVGPDNELQTYQYMITDIVVADGVTLFSEAPVIDAQTGVISFTPAADAFGSAEITVVLKDGDGTDNEGLDTSVEHTFTITILSVNDAPVFTDNGDLTVNEDSGEYSTAWITKGTVSAGPANEAQEAVFSLKLDESTLTVYGNSQLFATGPVIDSNTGEITFTPAENAYGFVNATVWLIDTDGTDNDGEDTSEAHTFLITVKTVNDAPVFTAGEDITVGSGTGAYSQDTWALDISAGPEDEALQALSFTVTVDKPALFEVQPAITPEGTLSFTPSATISGTAQMTVTLQDDGGTDNGGVDTSEQQQFSIQVVGSSELVLTGTVYDVRTLMPINGATVQLLDANGDEIASEVVGNDGVYRFTGLTSSNDTLTLAVSADGYQKNSVCNRGFLRSGSKRYGYKEYYAL